MRKCGKVEYVLKLQPLYVEPALIHHCVGVVVNLGNEHWVALKAISGKILLFDSLKNKPKLLQEAEYLVYVSKRRAAYPIAWAVAIGVTGEAVSSSPAENAGPVMPLAVQAAMPCSSMEVEMPPQADDGMEASEFAGDAAALASETERRGLE